MSIRAPVGRLRQIALVAVCAPTLYGPLIRAQQSTAQDQPRPTFRTEANYIRVDVYATARDGMPVTDLRREDFELLEDRVPQAIDQFFPIEIRTANAPVTRSARARRRIVVRRPLNRGRGSSCSSSMCCMSTASPRSASRHR